jgi:glycine betaine/choline ABC-type transport system substrate-binding protein
MNRKEVKKLVKSWDWNQSIWEVYDEVKHYSRKDKKLILSFADHYFNDEYSLKCFRDMASYWNIETEGVDWT